jgi:MFS family permease
VCAGSIYAVGLPLPPENTDDELRGRLFSALYTLVRLCLLIAFAVGPLLSEAANSISGRILTDHIWHLPGGREVYLPGVRITLWFAGALILLAGFVAFWSLRRAPRDGTRASVSDAGGAPAEAA